MSTPTCCGKRATKYRKEFPGRSWEEGYRCKKCGSIRLPFIDIWDSSFMDAMPAVRAAGMAWWGETEESTEQHETITTGAARSEGNCPT